MLGQVDLSSIDLSGLSSDIPDLNVASSGAFAGTGIDTTSLLAPYQGYQVTGADPSVFADPSLFSSPSDLFTTQQPVVSVASGGNPSTYGGVNPPATGSGSTSGLTYSDVQNATALLRNLAQLGTQTYATVDQINRGAGSAYSFQPGTQIDPATGLPVGTTAPATGGFSLSSLTDFSTPYPYLAMGGALLLIVLMTGDKKKGGKFGS